jgi:hypothetical protein
VRSVVANQVRGGVVVEGVGHRGEVSPRRGILVVAWGAVGGDRDERSLLKRTWGRGRGERGKCKGCRGRTA